MLLVLCTIRKNGLLLTLEYLKIMKSCRKEYKGWQKANRRLGTLLQCPVVSSRKKYAICKKKSFSNCQNVHGGHFFKHLFSDQKSGMHEMAETESSGSNLEVEWPRVPSRGEAVISRKMLAQDWDLHQKCPILGFLPFDFLWKHGSK